MDRRALFDTKTKLKEQEVEIAQLRKNMPNRAEQEQIMRNCQELQSQLYEEQQTVQSLRSQLIDPEILIEKDQTITRLESEKKNELAEVKREKDSETAKLRAEIESLNREVRTKQKM